MSEHEKALLEAVKKWAAATGWQRDKAKKELDEAVLKYRRTLNLYEDWVAENS